MSIAAKTLHCETRVHGRRALLVRMSNVVKWRSVFCSFFFSKIRQINENFEKIVHDRTDLLTGSLCALKTDNDTFLRKGRPWRLKIFAH